MNYIKSLFKILLSTGLLVYLILSADTNRIIEILSNIWHEGSVLYVLSAIGFFAISIFVFALRWQILLKAYGYRPSLWSLYRYYIMGLFFNNFLPTAIGGDVVRIYKIIQNTDDRNVGFASVMTERLLGMAGTLTLTMLALLFMSRDSESQMLLPVAGGLILAILVFFIFIFYPRFSIPVNPIIDRLKIFRLGERIHKFTQVLRHNNNNKSIYWKLLFTSMIGQMLIILMTYLLSLGLALRIPMGYLFLVVPITFLISMLPSINGLGVREGGYVFFLGKIGISKAGALSLSFLVVIIPLFISLFGGLLFLSERNKFKIGELRNAEN
jgi:uncharacterized protein (TIRG00374 family)